MELYKPGFIYTVEHVGVDGRIKSVEQCHNIIPTVGLNYLLGAGFTGTSQFTTWYLGLFDTAYSPVAGDTMASLLANVTENQEYTGTERQTITFPAVSGGALTTLADPNVFEFTSTETIRGAFITTTAPWLGTTGLLVSAVLFPSPKAMVSGEALRVPVGFALQSA